jgi:FkbM family methyltransferase
MKINLSRPMTKSGKLLFRINRRLRLEYWKAVGFLNPKLIRRFILPGGALFDYPLNSALGNSLSVENFESLELNFVYNSLSHGDVFIDIGANGGLYSILASKRIGDSGSIYAFEPGLRELDLLHHNIEINSCENIEVVAKALSNQQGSAQFAISYDGAMNSLRETDHPMQQIKEWQTVETTTLDQFVEDFSIQKVDFIKVDVEGAENLVFEGAKKVLSSDQKLTILFEACDSNLGSFGYSAKELVTKIRGFGFYIYFIDNNEKIVEVLDGNPDVGGKIYSIIACNRKI